MVMKAVAPANHLSVRITWSCAACANQVRSSQMVPVYGPIDPKLPRGWSLAMGRAYCDRHRIEMNVSERLTRAETRPEELSAA
jgi:hypothetical protein